MFKFIRVASRSLEPEYREGDYVTVITYPFFRLKRGDTIVFHHPEYGIMIKKVDRLDSDKIYAVGTHKDSIDSRRFGPINPIDVIGKVIWQIKKPEW
jgi:phage repressor protein C with HTH and peptisase S24 domain